MKIFKEGERSKAYCENCGLVETIFETRDCPCEDIIVPQILVGVCTKCLEIVSTPQQSAISIKKELDKRKSPKISKMAIINLVIIILLWMGIILSNRPY